MSQGGIRKRQTDTSAGTTFHIVSVGWGSALIEGILDRVQPHLKDTTFSHIVEDRHLGELGDRTDRGSIHRLRPLSEWSLPEADTDLLASLAGPEVPTLHNMIMADAVVRSLDYDDALRYATYLARRLEELYTQLRPAMVLGGFDGLHGGIALAVARRMGIPWFVMYFTTIPTGMSSFSPGAIPDAIVDLKLQDEVGLSALAERTLAEFEARALFVPAYLSANSLAMIVKRLPRHLKVLAGAIRRGTRGHHDRFTEYSTARMVSEYVRKRLNLFRLPKHWFCEQPPQQRYVFFGLHMQPEASVDVWAPYSANQAAVVEALARSLPPSHRLLVKIHKSDADNYSRTDLQRLRRLPGVMLVSPFASSRQFIDHASVVVTIQGTMALEAGLLGKPVLMFGSSGFANLPSVTLVPRLQDLPKLLRDKLKEATPDRDAIVKGYAEYLRPYASGCYADWQVLPNDEEIQNLARQFGALRNIVSSSHAER